MPVLSSLRGSEIETKRAVPPDGSTIAFQEKTMARRSLGGGGWKKAKRRASSFSVRTPDAFRREETSVTIPSDLSEAVPRKTESCGPSDGNNEQSSTAIHQADDSASVVCPLFYSLLSQKRLKPKGVYTVEDAREIFGLGNGHKVSRRTIQERISTGKLRSRNLPGRGRFLAEDFEHFLQNSVTERHGKDRK
jgi:hypothetical protein